MTNIQKDMKDLFGGACYAYCLAYIYSDEKDIKSLTKNVLLGWIKGYINNDGFVSQPAKYVNGIAGTNYKDAVIIDGLPPNDGKLYAVMWEYNGPHFVVMRGNKVMFDPYGDSLTVKYGKPISYRSFYD